MPDELPTLTREHARRVYDRIGARQDAESAYEGPALEWLCERAAFEAARAVVELGCGTGTLAERLLERRLPPDARYQAIDQSGVMVDLARRRLARFGARARVVRSGGGPRIELPERSVDRFVSTYVLDLLSEADIRAVLEEARRLLRPGGRLCLAGLTFPVTLRGRVRMGRWMRRYRRRPAQVGGCRPLDMRRFLGPERWRILERRVLERRGVPSEVLIATPAEAARPA